MSKQSLVLVFLVALAAISSASIDAIAGEPAAALGSHPVAAAANPGRGLLLGASGELPSMLVAIGPGTGVGTVIGPMIEDGPVPGPPAPAAFDAMATDPVTGIIYASGRSIGLSLPQLFLVDPITGALARREIATSTTGGIVAGFDFNADGTLFAAVHGLRDAGRDAADHLITIDVSTGALTTIGPFSECDFGFPGGLCMLEGIESIAFDSLGTLWATKGNRFPTRGDAGLYRVDPKSGDATFVGPFTGPAGGVGPSGGIEGLQFACGGALFGGTGAAVGGAQDGGRLVRVNRRTGKVTPVGASPPTPGGGRLSALAFSLSSCTPRQTVAAMRVDLNALVAVGAFHRSAALPLQNLLRNAARALSRGKTRLAKVMLHRVIAVARTLQGRRGRLPRQTADGLIAAAQGVLRGL